MPDFYSIIKYKKVYKTQFSEGSVKFTKYEKKSKQKRKRKNFSSCMKNWKKKLNNFCNIKSQWHGLSS